MANTKIPSYEGEAQLNLSGDAKPKRPQKGDFWSDGHSLYFFNGASVINVTENKGLEEIEMRRVIEKYDTTTFLRPSLNLKDLTKVKKAQENLKVVPGKDVQKQSMELDGLDGVKDKGFLMRTAKGTYTAVSLEELKKMLTD
jgi:hypothetical protein